MITKELDCFNIAQICDSGQCFRMRQKRDNLYSVIAGNEYLEVTQNGGQCTFHCDENKYETFWKKYFDLNADYKKYIESIDEEDSYLKKSLGIWFWHPYFEAGFVGNDRLISNFTAK